MKSRRPATIAGLAMVAAALAVAFGAVFSRRLTFLVDRPDAVLLSVVWTALCTSLLCLVRVLHGRVSTWLQWLLAITSVVAFLVFAGKQFPDLRNETPRYRTEVDRIETVDGTYVARRRVSRYAFGSGNLAVTRDVKLFGGLHWSEVIAVRNLNLEGEKFRLRTVRTGRVVLTFGSLIVVEFDAG